MRGQGAETLGPGVHERRHGGALHWGHQSWERAASEVVDRTETALLNDIGPILFAVKLITVSVASDGDVLSQWRAYAADGAGYAVGFRAADLANLPVQALRVS